MIERSPAQRRGFLRIWLPVILWTGVIVLESTLGSSGNTGPLLVWIARKLFGEMEPATFATLHHLVRKAGHFFGYGILGVLWYRALRSTVERTHPSLVVALALAATFATASLDEWHQSFSSARTAAFSDVLLDTAGALVLIMITILMTRATFHPDTSAGSS